ncbi:MAG TPA: hypothetical protein VMA34_06375 [Terracidiphilus sp.]|nr:hypothetical protein [Terracidiphilus sp.]
MKKHRIGAALAAAALLAAPVFAAPDSASVPTIAGASAALQAGEADRALSLLAELPQDGPDGAQAQNLVCRVRFTLEQWSAAARACAIAVRLEPQNSDYRLWFGRALGEEAGVASFFSAYSLGKRSREEFEAAVQLDPRNAAALSDLGEFYADAPGIVGGGTDKAEAVAAQLDRIDPARAAVLRGRIASDQKDYAAAERDFKAAVAVSRHPALQWSTLGSFYRHRQQWQQMEWAIHNCVAAATRDRAAGLAFFNGASVLVQAHREPALAAKMLEEYLAGPSLTEEGPAFVAHIWLAHLKMQLGDPAGARQDLIAAHALAGEYKPKEDSGA